MNYLNRDHAPFPSVLWNRIDIVAVEAAKSLLTARRFLDVEGPFGLDLTSLELGSDDYCHDPDDNDAAAITSRAIAVPMIRKSCRLSVRRVAASLDRNAPLNLTEVQDAAEAVARREEALIYFGQPELGLHGLLNVEGRSAIQGKDWTSLDNALDNVLAAVNALDQAGYHGPYALTLPPALFNNLFRHYEHTDLLQIEHLKSLCTLGVYKAELDRPVLVDPHVGALAIGQDLRVGYENSDGIHYRLFVTESLVLRIDDPGAVCSLGA